MEMELLTPVAVKKEYMNNTRVGQVICRNTGLIDMGDFDVMVLPQKRTSIAVNLLRDEHVQYTGDITLFDMGVMDSIYTLYKSGMESFTLQMVMRTLSGNSEQNVLEEQQEEIFRSIEKLRHIDISIDCTEELRIRKKIGKKDSVVYRSYLLPLSTVKIKIGNQKIINGYKLLEIPALYAYAELLEQIIDVPTQVFRTQKRLSDNNEVIVLKRYLIQRIAIMKNTRNKVVSKKISYQWYDRKTKEEKGLFAVLGYKREHYSSKSSWANKKKKIHTAVCKILDTLVEEKYIDGYCELRENQSLVGVEIILPDSKTQKGDN